MGRAKISKLTEVVASSPHSFEDAVSQALYRANKSLAGIRLIEVLDKKIRIAEGKIEQYEVRLNLIFELAPDLDMHE